MFSVDQKFTNLQFIQAARLVLVIVNGFILLVTAHLALIYLRHYSTTSFVTHAKRETTTSTVTDNAWQQCHSLASPEDDGSSPKEVDLTVFKRVDQANPAEGDVIAYTVVVTNFGPDSATGVHLIDSLPDGLEYISHTTRSGVYNPLTGLWEVGDIIARCNSAVLIITATVSPGTAGLTIINTANELTVNEFDLNPDNNESEAMITVAGADLVIDLNVSDIAPQANTTITYTTLVTNLGPSPVASINVIDSLPLYEFSSYAVIPMGVYTNGVWKVGKLDVGRSVTLTKVATLKTCPIHDPITHTSVIATPLFPPDPNLTNNNASTTISVYNKECHIFLPVIYHDYIKLTNGDFEAGQFTGWFTAQGPYLGHGSGLPQVVTPFEGSQVAYLGNEFFQNNNIPVGYSSIAQTFTIEGSYLQIRYRIITYDVVKGFTPPFINNYFDTFEISINLPPEQINDQQRTQVGCGDTLVSDGTTRIVTGSSLVLCDGFDGNQTKIRHDLGWKTVFLDLSQLSENATLYLTLWGREHEINYRDDHGHFNTWVYIDDIKLTSSNLAPKYFPRTVPSETKAGESRTETTIMQPPPTPVPPYR